MGVSGRSSITALGRYARERVERLRRSGHFAASSFRDVRDVSKWGPLATLQARSLGVDSLPIGIFLAIFTGIVLALLSS